MRVFKGDFHVDGHVATGFPPVGPLFLCDVVQRCGVVPNQVSEEVCTALLDHGSRRS